MNQSQKIVPCLWFDSNAEEAANFYTSLLPDSSLGRILRYGEAGQEITGKQPGSVLTVEFAMAGFHFVALNGGPQFTINPAISFFISCASEAEAAALWAKLSAGGFALMPLDSYPWSKKYGWVQDRFGVSWQLMLGPTGDGGQKIVPCLMYVREHNGKAEEAILRYTSLFDNAQVHVIDRYQAGEGNTEGAVKHAQFALNGESFVAMDGDADLEKRLPFPESQTLGYQLSCMLAMSDSICTGLAGNDFSDHDTAFANAKSKITIDAMRLAMQQSDSKVLAALETGDLFKAGETSMTPIHLYLYLIEHEALHHGQLINFIYAHHLPIPPDWFGEWNLTRDEL
jgi:predicted 3-demethylubiquinone-9 3-methyltransferase (glyoxalase superfamily)